MSYHIGDVAKILGLSRQGVRFFERKGYLPAGREKNGYRVFERRDLTVAQQIQDYASVGFTLEEASRLVLDSDLPEIDAALAGCERRIEGEILRLERMKERLERRRRLAGAARRSQPPGPMENGGLLYLPLEGECALPDGAEKHEAERRWMSVYPDVLLAKIALHRDGSACTSKGILADAEDAARLSLPVPEGVIAFQPGLYWTEAIPRRLGSTKPFEAAFRRMRAEGFAPTGPMLSAVVMTYAKNGVQWSATQLLMPCRPESAP